METYEKGVNAWYSLGFKTNDLSVQDVLVGSLVDREGSGPGMKLIAITDAGRPMSCCIMRLRMPRAATMRLS